MAITAVSASGGVRHTPVQALAHFLRETIDEIAMTEPGMPSKIRSQLYLHMGPEAEEALMRDAYPLMQLSVGSAWSQGGQDGMLFGIRYAVRPRYPPYMIVLWRCHPDTRKIYRVGGLVILEDERAEVAGA